MTRYFGLLILLEFNKLNSHFGIFLKYKNKIVTLKIPEFTHLNFRVLKSKRKKMIKKFLVAPLLLLILNLAMTPTVWASGNSEKEAKLAEKVKTGIAKLGAGTDSKVKLKLKDGTKLKGFISEISEDGFVVKNEKTGESVSVPYSSVKQVRGNNLRGDVIAVVALIALIAIPLLIYVAQKEKT